MGGWWRWPKLVQRQAPASSAAISPRAGKRRESRASPQRTHRSGTGASGRTGSRAIAVDSFTRRPNSTGGPPRQAPLPLPGSLLESPEEANMTKVLAMILAGGEGRRLDPLTRERAKPAVPFGGRYRIIDFVLSNFANSGIVRMKVLVQYKSDSLNTHVQRAWRLTSLLNEYVEIVPAQMRYGPKWFEGSADAIYQNLNIITDEEPDYTFVFGADHVYRMDVRQMLDYHTGNQADLTVAAIPVPRSEASDFGIIEMAPDGRMIGFVEKPKPGTEKTMPGDDTKCLASMGNYLFRTDALVQEIVRDAGDAASAHDFGKSIVTSMHSRKRVFVYDFMNNRVPGQSEKERGYWRDVGSLDAYYQANMDLVDVDPIFSLYNFDW